MVKPVFYAEWVREQQLDPTMLVTVYTGNDKMAPRIQCGDHLLVDRSQNVIDNGRIYALWYLDRLWIKRLYEQDDGCLLITADSPDDGVPPLCLSAEARDSLHIIGRVIHIQGTAGL